MADMQMGLLVLLGVVVSLAASWLLTARSSKAWQQNSEILVKENRKISTELQSCKSRIERVEQEFERMRLMTQTPAKRPVVEAVASPVRPASPPGHLPVKQPTVVQQAPAPAIVTTKMPEAMPALDDFEVLQATGPLAEEPVPSQEEQMLGPIMNGINAIVVNRLAVTKPLIMKSILDAAVSEAERDSLRSLNIQIDFFGLDGTPSSGIVELVLLVVKEKSLVVPHYNSLANPFLGTWFETNRNQQPMGIIECARARLDKDTNTISCIQKGRINL